MEKQLLQVKQFQDAFGFDSPKVPQMLDEDRASLRVKLIREEVSELKAAKDIVHVADALMDILYLTYGSLHEYGLADRAILLFDEVHRSNMSKMGEDGKPIFRHDGKVLKPETYSAPNLRLIIERDFDMYAGNEVLSEIAEQHKKDTNKIIEDKIKGNLKWYDRILLWIMDSIETKLKKKVVIKYPQSSLGDIIVSVYGKDYVVK